MEKQPHSSAAPETQALFNQVVEDFSSADPIEQYRASERGDSHAAFATIAQEIAEVADDADGHPSPPRPRWLLAADRSQPRIEVAAAEVVGGILTFRRVGAAGATRSEALGKLARRVRDIGDLPAWEDT
jgi:hypothetical protein